MVGVCAVVAGHSLEVSAEDAFLSADSLEGLGCVVLESFELDSGVRKRGLDLIGVFLGLVEMTAPFFAIGCILVDLQLVCTSLDFESPLFLADI